MDKKIILEQLKNNLINNDDLEKCLCTQDMQLIGQSLFLIIERKYFSVTVAERLIELSDLLCNNKLIGPYQFGHIAIAALYLLDNEYTKKEFDKIYRNLSEDDQFLVDNYIKGVKQENS